MTPMLTVNTLHDRGEYLGFDPNKGYIYSVYCGTDLQGNKKYRICNLVNGIIFTIIEFTAYCKQPNIYRTSLI